MKLKNKIIFIIICMFSFIFLPEACYAANHSFDITAYYCDKNEYNAADDVTNYENCLQDYVDGNLNSYRKEDGAQIDNGSIMLFILNYHLGPAAEVNGFNFTYYYDDSKWTPGLDGTDLYYDEDIYDITDDLIKKNSDGRAKWNFSAAADVNTSSLNFVLVDDNTTVALDKDYVVGYFFMKVKDGVNGNATITPTTNFREVSLTDTEAEIEDGFDFTQDLVGISFTTGSGSEVSTDATLDTLTVTNNGTNYFSPTFVSGSETLNYTVYVPYNVTSIDLQATTHDEEATIGDEITGTGLGTKNLDVGAQTYNITVYSKAGNSLTYAVTVYRLNHDATIKNLSFTNSVGFPATNQALQNTFEYTTTVPFATKDTTPTAVPNDSNASIVSGLSKWTISSVGENTFTIMAEAEDCAYPTIQNNAYSNCGKQTYTFKINKEEPSSNTYLSTITKAFTVNGVKETASQLPGYVKTKKNYDLGQVSNETTKITLNATVEASGKAKIKSSDLGEKTLNVGLNEFEINVTAEDGTPDKYTIRVYRKSANKYLKTLTVTSTPAGHGSLNTALNKTILTGYRFNYDELATSYTVYAEVEDTDKAYVSIYNTDGTIGSASQLNNNTYTFDITNTQVLITVTAEDGKINNYVLDAGRVQSADSTLKALDVTSGSGDTYTEYTLTPEFPANTRNYALTVESDVSEVSINAIPTSAFASIKEIRGNYENLSFNNVNKIEIIVEAEDRSTSSYTIDITRKKYSIDSLSSLNVTLNGETYDLKLPLNNVDLEYELDQQIPYSIDGTKVTSVTVNATPTDTTYASVSGTGSRNIHTGSQVLDVTVTAHDGTKKIYKLTVIQKKNTDNSISNLTIRGITPTLVSETADVTSYEMEVDNSITQVSPSDVVFNIPDGATKNVNQTIQLKTKQDNIYTFTVTSENGEVHEYDVNITRTSAASNNISLVTLTIGNDSSRTCVMSADNSCVIEVPVDTTAFSLSATIADTATISPANGTEYELPASQSSKEVPLTVTAENGEIKEYTVNVLRAKSSNNDLSALTINGKTISELTNNVSTFNPATTTYNITVDGTVSKALVNATVADTDKASLDIVNTTNSFNENDLDYVVNTDSDEFDLTQEKVNVIKVYVKAENGQVKYYTLNITRALRTNAFLSDLTYNGVTITNFNKNTFEYTLPDVIYNIPTVTIGATTEDEAATKGGDGILSISTGPNTITVTVTAQDRVTTQDYIIHINRAKNNDTGIKGITLAGVQARKNTTTGDYEVTVPNNILEANSENLVVTVNDPKVETDAKATVSFENQMLFTEDNHPNIIPITVTAEDGENSKVYNLHVTRTKSSIATLTNILVKDLEGNVIGSFGTKPFVADTFTPDEEDGIVMTYNVTVPVDTTEFVIEAVKTEPHESIVGDGRYTLDTTAEDSVTTKTITVTSEDTNVVYNYVLNITRNKSNDNFLKSITVTSPDGTVNYPLSPTFTQNGTSYTVNVDGDVEQIKLSAEKNDNRATIEHEEGILTTHNIEVGDNKINIKVISESGSPNTYQVNIVRALKPYNNLGKLIINEDTILDNENSVNKFNSENKYTLVEVPYKTTKVNYSLETEDSDATTEVKVKNEAGVTSTVTGDEIMLSTGINEITITVTAQNSMKKTYTVFVTRTKNNDATLKTITVKNIRGTQSEVITVTPDTDTYYVTVDEKKEVLYSLEVLYAKSDAKATVTLDSDLPLITSNAGVFPNEFNIHVVAEDGQTEHNYKLLVRRPKSSDTRIKEVELNGATNESTFKDNVYAYTLNIPYNRDTFTIRGIPNVSTTTVSGNFTYTYYLDADKQPHLSYVENGETKVIDGNKVTLTATAENGETQDYVFTVKSAKTDDTVVTNIQVLDQPFTTTFAQNISDYTLKNNLDVSIDALRVVVTTRNPDATYACVLDGVTYDCQNNNLNIPSVAGTKTITVVITSASGTKTKEYYINYTKVYSSDASLSQIQLVEPNIDLGFNSATTSYSVNVNNEVENAKFQFQTSDANATVFINNEELTPSNGVYEYTLSDLVEGENSFTIVVKAQDGEATESYTLTVNRAEPEASSDAFLDSLSVENFEFTENFEMDKYIYDIGQIPYSTSTLNVIAHANYTKSRISYNLDGRNAQDNGLITIPIEDGQHIIYVNVIAEDGTTTNSYQIKYSKEASKNNLLRDVSLDNAELEFDPETNSYNIEVDTDTKNMIATIIVDDPKSTVQIGATTYTSPNESAIVYNVPTLAPGDNKLQIIVIPESGTPANVYEINIKRQKDELITSYEFGHVIEDGYIKTGILAETGLDLKNELDNKNEHLKIYNADKTREISDTEKISTGYIVSLIVDDIIQDEKKIVVKGDVNGDGNITLIDAVGTINHYVGVQNNDSSKRRLVGEYFVAADTNTNGGVSLIDAVGIINHYTNKTRLTYKR